MSEQTVSTKSAAPPRKPGFLEGSSIDQPALAAGLMIFALMLLGLQDALIKFTSGMLSLWQFQLIRSSLNLLLVLILARMIWGTSRPAPKRWWAVMLRSFFLVVTMVFFFAGIPFLSLAEIAAGLYVYPLYIAVLSGVFLGERVGPRRVFAILAGFVGTLLILKPGTDSFRLVNLLPVIAALWYALTVMSTRKLCREESPVTLAFGVAITFLAAGLVGTLALSTSVVSHALGTWPEQWPYLFSGWRDIPMWVVGLIMCCSLLNVTANISLSKSYQSAESSWLAPFDYSYLIFATFWGFVFSGTIPDNWTFAGMSLIAAAGIFVAWRERVEKKELERRANFHRNLR